jgi:hypothetical protein
MYISAPRRYQSLHCGTDSFGPHIKLQKAVDVARRARILPEIFVCDIIQPSWCKTRNEGEYTKGGVER